MQASSSTHRLAKRSTVLDPPLIAGIAVVVVLINIVLALAWFTCRGRQQLKAHKRRISSAIDVEKYEHSVAFAVATGGAPSAIHTKAAAAGAGDRKSYFELIQALQRQPSTPSPARLSRGSSQESAESRRLSDYVLRPQDMKEFNGVPRYPRAKGRVQALRRSAIVVSPNGSTLTRSNSLAETASVYSSASAPLDYHEQLFRAQPFGLNPSAPTNPPGSEYPLPKPPPPAAVPQPTQAADDHKQRLSSPAQTPAGRRRPSHPDVPSTPSMSPTSTMSPLSPRLRSRANSNPHAIAPQVMWLQKEDASRPSPLVRRPSSVSSLSMILALHRAAAAPAVQATSVAPLNVHRRSKDALAGVAPTPARADVDAGPTIPPRSPRRPAKTTSSSVEDSEST
ncbi:hypothetical protein TRAPUB_8919 [Trametes pubescens]|uniref:Uncharacterized protein n=1 Tax=Trametes pubescens TaxID=154538 RepID=A0A1M2W3X9_TRAPU|nr:hypothetical protein TRAPUB_8919 [Trametes pubescens]